MAQDIYLKGTSGDWYEDVTFRLKDKYVNNTPKDLSNYADELISRHMKLKGYTENNNSYVEQNIKKINEQKNLEIVKRKNLYDSIEIFCILSLVFVAFMIIICLII